MCYQRLFVLLLLLFPFQVFSQTCNNSILSTAPNSRYTVNDNEVTDNETGLIWQKCSQGQTGNDCSGSAAKLTWQAALDVAQSTREQTGVNWRLPNINELESLVEEKCFVPAINLSVFPNTNPKSWADASWSGSPSAYDSDNAWSVNFRDGSSKGYLDKSTDFYVRLVRDGQSSDFLPSQPGNSPFVAQTDSTTSQPENSPPVAQFNKNTSEGNIPLQVVVDGSASSDSDGSIVSWFWNTSDSQFAQGQSASFTFNQAETITISLLVTDDHGNTHSSSQTVTVKAATNQQPQTTESCGKNWEWRNPLPQGNVLRDVVWSKEQKQYIAVGSTGTILTSIDGITWQTQSSGTSSDLNATSWNGQLWVAVGSSGTILTSSDGIKWQTQSSGVSNWLMAISWNGQLWVAVGGREGLILTSSDGINWQKSSTNNSYSDWLNSISWNGQQWVAVGREGLILTSSDGSSWQTQSSGTSDELYAISWNGQQWVAVARNGTILTSSDGSSWQTQSSGTNDDLEAISWNGQQWVAAGNAIVTSSDGIGWQQLPRVQGSRLNAINWNGQQWVAVGYSGTILTSSDGVSWQNQTSGTGFTFNDISWNGELWVAVGFTGVIWTSSDGISWQVQPSGTRSALFAISWNDELWVTVGSSGIILTSSDGISWQAQSSETDNKLTAVSWNDQLWVAVGESGTILTSSDGINWQAQSSGVGNKLNATSWNGQQWVAVGSSGIILTSSDGINWQPQDSWTREGLEGISWNDQLWVAVGSSGIILTSSDGISWQGQSTGKQTWLSAISWNGQLWIAVGYPGIILTSSDGISWQAQSSETDNKLTAVSWNDQLWVAVGWSGTILTSTCNSNFSVDPVPSIKVNASKGPVSITTADNLSITVGLDSGSSQGQKADWWIAALTPFDWFHFDAADWKWKEGLNVSFQGSLFDFDTTQVLNVSNLPKGTYTLYFAVDMSPNSSVDQPLVYDSVSLTVSDSVQIINSSPVISGAPITTVKVGDNYTFTPSASDPDGDNLTFSIINKPAWVSFNSLNGTLSGVPSTQNIGSFNNILISVSDGVNIDKLPTFNIVVEDDEIDDSSNIPSLIGTWSVTAREDASSCGEGIYTEHYTATIAVNGTQVSITFQGSTIYGEINKNIVTYSNAHYPDDGGTTTTTGTLVFNGNTYSGKSNWSWTDGLYSCSGTTMISAEKI